MKRRKQRGLAMLSLIIIIACILIIGGTIAIWLAHLAKRLLGPPPGGGGGGTNTTQQITVTVPPLEFTPLPAPADATVDRPMGSAYFVLERSTNLVNWEEVDTNTGPNPAIPMEFFRGKVVYPK